MLEAADQPRPGLDPHGLAQRLLAFEAEALAPGPLALQQLADPLPGVVRQTQVVVGPALGRRRAPAEGCAPCRSRRRAWRRTCDRSRANDRRWERGPGGASEGRGGGDAKLRNPLHFDTIEGGRNSVEDSFWCFRQFFVSHIIRCYTGNRT